MLRCARTVLSGQSLDGDLIEQLALASASAKNELLDDRPESVAQPPPNRHRKSHLLSCQDFRRD